MPPAHVTLTGQVAIVTGAAGQLGRAISDKLEAEGARVARTDVAATDIRLDVTDRASIEKAAEQIATSLGEPTILVNNAGVMTFAPSAVHHDDLWQRAIDVNLTGAFLCSQVVGTRMLKAGQGAIVNIASVAAVLGVPAFAAYCASKAGLVGLTRALAAEWAAQGIRVNAVCPGFLRTPDAEKAAQLGAIELDAIVKRTPTARLPELDEIASVVSFLASPAASGMSGDSVTVDGGFTISGSVPMDLEPRGGGKRRRRREEARTAGEPGIEHDAEETGNTRTSARRLGG